MVDEGAEKFEPELKVQARDKDKTSKITYALVGGNELGLFAVDADTGEISIKSPVDMTNATHDWIALTIQASDGIFVDSALVNITVRDVNNNAPMFPHDIYTASIAEISPIGRCLVLRLTTPRTDNLAGGNRSRWTGDVCPERSPRIRREGLASRGIHYIAHR